MSRQIKDKNIQETKRIILNNIELLKQNVIVDIYNQKKMIAVVGSGDYEYLVLGSNHRLAEIPKEKGI